MKVVITDHALDRAVERWRLDVDDAKTEILWIVNRGHFLRNGDKPSEWWRYGERLICLKYEDDSVIVVTAGREHVGQKADIHRAAKRARFST